MKLWDEVNGFRVIAVVFAHLTEFCPQCAQNTRLWILWVELWLVCLSHFPFEKNILRGQLGIGSIEYFNFTCFLGSFRASGGIFAHCIVYQCRIYVAFILVPNGFRIPSGTCLFLFQPHTCTTICKKKIKKWNFTDLKKMGIFWNLK